MMNAEPGVMQLGQSVTQHGRGLSSFTRELGISDFRKYSWGWQEDDDGVERGRDRQVSLLYKLGIYFSLIFSVPEKK